MRSRLTACWRMTEAWTHAERPARRVVANGRQGRRSAESSGRHGIRAERAHLCRLLAVTRLMRPTAHATQSTQSSATWCARERKVAKGIVPSSRGSEEVISARHQERERGHGARGASNGAGLEAVLRSTVRGCVAPGPAGWRAVRHVSAGSLPLRLYASIDHIYVTSHDNKLHRWVFRAIDIR